jgi:hypothetical protein
MLESLRNIHVRLGSPRISYLTRDQDRTSNIQRFIPPKKIYNQGAHTVASCIELFVSALSFDLETGGIDHTSRRLIGKL